MSNGIRTQAQLTMNLTPASKDLKKIKYTISDSLHLFIPTVNITISLQSSTTDHQIHIITGRTKQNPELHPAVTVPETQLLEFIYFPNDPYVSDTQQRVWRQNGLSVRLY